jgi:hypothetical protein
VGKLGEGWGKQGQFTSNLRRRRTIPVTAGGCQVSGKEYKGGKRETARGAKGIGKGIKEAAPCIYVAITCM